MPAEIQYFILEQDKSRYIKVIYEYFRFFCTKPEEEAKELAEEGYENAIRHQNFDGEKVVNTNLTFFDDLLNVLTEKFYSPSTINRNKYPIGVKKVKGAKRGKGKKANNITPTDPVDAQKAVAEQAVAFERIKKNLLSEYPSLDRKDLQESVDNYCKLQIQIHSVLALNVLDSSTTVKNLIDAQIKLGGHLGIDESAKAKQKELEDRQSIAALALQYQKTVDNFPEIRKRMRYKELRMLVNKYDRNEISAELFELPSYAGCTILVAKEFVKENEAEFESSK